MFSFKIIETQTFLKGGLMRLFFILRLKTKPNEEMNVSVFFLLLNNNQK